MKLSLLVFYIFIETILTISIASKVGALFTFLEILLSGFVGFFIFSNTPQKVSENFKKLREKKIELLTFKHSSILRVIGAFLIILPGFLGDVIGVFLIIFATLSPSMKGNFSKKNNKHEEFIDVEIIDDSSSL